MLTQEDLRALQTMMETTIDKKLEPIKQDIAGMKTDISGLKNDMAEVKESLAEVREGVNYLTE